MSLTPDQLRTSAAAMLAFADGKPIECQNPRGAWVQTDSLSGIETIPHRPAPWTLPAPPAGKQWHRTDWTEEMLPGSFRPLLLGERAEAGDTCFPEMTRRWEPVMGILGLSVDGEFCPVRTLRPLPVEPVTRPWSKPEDVPLNCWLGWEDPDSSSAEGAMVVVVHGNGVSVAQKDEILFLSWSALKRKETLHSTDRKTWLPCVTQEP